MNLFRLLRRVNGSQKLLQQQIITNQYLINIEGIQRESYYAQLLSDTIRESSWMMYKSISPTGWALNYNAIYFLYKILDLIHPTNIVEFGLGQSSKIIYQYTKAYAEVQAITYEHDKDWISFFRKNLPADITPNIFLTELEHTTYKEQNTLSYKNNCDELKDKKFDFILVDGPFGSEHYSRSQILNIVPTCLKDSFIIMIDDAERNGEQETIKELLMILDDNNIKYQSAFRSSNKSFFIAFSCNNKYITTI